MSLLGPAHEVLRFLASGVRCGVKASLMLGYGIGRCYFAANKKGSEDNGF